MSLTILIPAYNPEPQLPEFVERLQQTGKFAQIVVVNDGSSPEHDSTFARLAAMPQVRVLGHAVNLGKGTALKTGMNSICLTHPGCIGIITADADGQHHPRDIVRVAEQLEENCESLILGARDFGSDVPLRSRFGNIVTKYIFRGLVGTKLSDTQSGLRGIPLSFAKKLLTLKSTGYEFELEMLVQCKHQNIRIIQCPIETIYLDDNSSSHFNPLFDSLRIYFVLLRFMMASLVTAAFDYMVFLAAYALTSNILIGQAAARLFATGINFLLVREAVFHSRESARKTFPKFVLLVITMGAVSYAMIQTFVEGFGWGVVAAKVAAESIVYLANFAIQRDFIFSRSRKMNDLAPGGAAASVAAVPTRTAPLKLANPERGDDEQPARKAA